ncbi:hypothetical protein ACS0TY_023899 [Phlomoides rotata]
MAYNLLRSSHPRVGWSSWIWGSFIPPCHSTLIWRAIWGKLHTADWLRHFGVHGPTVCFLCHNDLESLDHIFAHCYFPRNLLCKVTDLFDLNLYYDISFMDVFSQATTFQFGKQLSCLWRIAFIKIVWSVWHARNRAVFDEVQPFVHRSLAFILASIKEVAPLARGHIWHSRNKDVFDKVQPSIPRSLAFILASIKETDHLALGHMAGSVREFLIMDHLGISGGPSLVHSTTVIRWKPPQAG